MTKGAVILPFAAALAALAPAAQPAAFQKSSPGLWEVRRIPDGKPQRLCVADVSMLAQIEHHGESCTRKVIGGEGASTILRYTCPAGGFGQSRVTMVTPRSLTIETQGISDGLPFNYTVQARRVGDCGNG